MFWKKKKTQIEYDPEKEYPVIKASICTGEEVGGFCDKQTGRFRDVCLIRTQAEQIAFCQSCGITPEEIRKIY